GIEIWGGTVNLKYLSIWNIGDDSLDIDQGFRGKVQFGLIVQGYSKDDKQGSGVGDNCCETDGAEDSHYQPVTTTSIYNFTIIGQPDSGDRATAWRDNARVQYYNCIFMDCGEEIVGFDDKDGDGGNGYGYQGTASWAATWTTPYTQYSTVNAPTNPAAFYQAQHRGNWAGICNSVFYNNLSRSAYTEADARGVFAAANGNVKEPTNSPITSITRAAAVLKGGLSQRRVTALDPRPANDALNLAVTACPPNDGFWSPVRVRGAFTPGNNWLVSWTSSWAYGITTAGTPWTDLGNCLTGKYCCPNLALSGPLTANSTVNLSLTNAIENAPAYLGFGLGATLDLPFMGGVLVPNIGLGGAVPIATNSQGQLVINNAPFVGLPKGTLLTLQCWIVDANGPFGLSASNAVCGEAQ
ncbi:MAG: hypothetical protein KDC87_07070, partial [Planctomycetes bacterium]|nr:hypothetical protein [Planctomycetota bacterium]